VIQIPKDISPFLVFDLLANNLTKLATKISNGTKVGKMPFYSSHLLFDLLNKLNLKSESLIVEQRNSARIKSKIDVL